MGAGCRGFKSRRPDQFLPHFHLIKSRVFYKSALLVFTNIYTDLHPEGGGQGGGQSGGQEIKGNRAAGCEGCAEGLLRSREKIFSSETKCVRYPYTFPRRRTGTPTRRNRCASGRAAKVEGGWLACRIVSASGGVMLAQADGQAAARKLNERTRNRTPEKSLPHPPPSRRWDSFGISRQARRLPDFRNAWDSYPEKCA